MDRRKAWIELGGVINPPESSPLHDLGPQWWTGREPEVLQFVVPNSDLERKLAARRRRGYELPDVTLTVEQRVELLVLRRRLIYLEELEVRECKASWDDSLDLVRVRGEREAECDAVQDGFGIDCYGSHLRRRDVITSIDKVLYGSPDGQPFYRRSAWIKDPYRRSETFTLNDNHLTQVPYWPWLAVPVTGVLLWLFPNWVLIPFFIVITTVAVLLLWNLRLRPAASPKVRITDAAFEAGVATIRLEGPLGECAREHRRCIDKLLTRDDSELKHVGLTRPELHQLDSRGLARLVELHRQLRELEAITDDLAEDYTEYRRELDGDIRNEIESVRATPRELLSAVEDYEQTARELQAPVQEVIADANRKDLAASELYRIARSRGTSTGDQKPAWPGASAPKAAKKAPRRRPRSENL